MARNASSHNTLDEAATDDENTSFSKRRWKNTRPSAFVLREIRRALDMNQSYVSRIDFAEHLRVLL